MTRVEGEGFLLDVEQRFFILSWTVSDSHGITVAQHLHAAMEEKGKSFSKA